MNFFPRHCILIGDPVLPQRNWPSQRNGRPPVPSRSQPPALPRNSGVTLTLSLPCLPPYQNPQPIRPALFSECIHHLGTSHPSPMPLAPAHIISPLACYSPLLIPCCQDGPMDTHRLTLLASSLVSGDDHGSPAPQGCWRVYTPNSSVPSECSRDVSRQPRHLMACFRSSAPFSDFTLDVFPLLSCTFS